MGICFVVGTHLQCLLEDSYHICSVSCRYEVERAANFFNEFVPARRYLFIHVDFVSYNNARNVGAVIAHLLVPISQVCVGNLALSIKHQYTNVGPKIVRWMQFIERFLPRSIPDVHLLDFALHIIIIAVHGKRMCR